MRLDADGFSISELIDRIDQGTVALPEFQRDFVWRPNQIADLLRSVARHWPIGSFLLLEVEGQAPFQVRALESAPALTTPTRLVLDGQQRTTAVYQAFGEHAEEVYYIDLGAVIQLGEFDDDHLLFLKRARFDAKYPNIKAEAENRVVRVSTLADERTWQRWLSFLPEDPRLDAVDAKVEYLPGFAGYDIPAYRLEKDADLAAVAKIFETINRTGQRLAVFDLMVARLYPSGFNLKDKWEAARGNNEVLARYDYGDDQGIEILKVIALREHLRQRSEGSPITIKGVREADVLGLSPALVIGGWDGAVAAYSSALEFVRDRCGMVRPLLLPAPAMLLVLADVLHPETHRRVHMERDLERWVWAAMFRQDYGQGANTQAVRDARQLRAWQEAPSAKPDALATFAISEELLMEGRRRNEQLLRGLLALSVFKDARDWITDTRFSEVSDPLEAHHVFPADWLNDHYAGEKDPVANYALLTKSTNAALRDKLPKDVLLDPAVVHTAVESHLGVRIDDLTEPADFVSAPSQYAERFVAERATRLVAIMKEAVGL